jgi:hypothetical protein
VRHDAPAGPKHSNLLRGNEVRAMATDYDTPRKTDEELHEESLEELKAKRVDAQSAFRFDEAFSLKLLNHRVQIYQVKS